MAVKPTFKPEIARSDVNLPNIGTTNKLRPRATWRTTGFDKGDYLAAQEFNWMFDNNCDWVNYFEEVTDDHEIRISAIEDDTTYMKEGENISLLTNNSNYQSGAQVDNTITTMLDNIYPLGSIVFNTSGANPSTYIGVGSWTQVAQGRFIVGEGQGTDANLNTRTYSTGNDSVGEYTHTMTEAELVPHNHTTTIDYRGINTAAEGNAYTPDASASSGTEDTDNTGGGTAFNVAPPAFGMFVWLRNG